MVIQRINEVIETLQQAGMKAQRGFPAQKMPYLTASVAGVSIEQVKDDSVVLAVQIYTPLQQGGAACENTALQAVEALEQLRGSYQIQGCSFDGKTGLFHMTVLATFQRHATE